MVEARKTDIEAAGCDVAVVNDERKLCRRTAEMVADGKVVGWFQGRLEWGPRALGNRSIVCDPRRADMKEILNAKIKRRESFRPFAPSVLDAAVPEWFEEDDAVPFMMQVFQIREDKRAQIPAVTHVDGSGRLQTVNRATNPRTSSLPYTAKPSRACRWCSTHRSTRTSRWCASRKKRWIASSGPRWICWFWAK